MLQLAFNRLGLPLLVCWSTLRIMLYGALDKRPLLGFEAADLQRSMFYHYGLRAHLDYGFLEQIGRDGFKPPLWYGGVPILFSWRDTLSSLDYLLVNAIALGVAALVVWILARRLGGALVGAFSVVCLCALPGVAGAATVIGVEMVQLAAMACLVLLLIELASPRATTRTAGVTGVVLGLGMLAKWTLVVYLAVPVLGLLVALRPSDGCDARPLMRLVVALGLAAALLLLWLVPYGDLGAILAGAGGEASHPSRWGAATLLYYPRELLFSSLGVVAAPVVLLSLWGFWRGRAALAATPEARTSGALLLAVVVSGPLLLTLLPHKELRYLVPIYPAVVILLGWGLGLFWRDSGRAGRAGVGAALAVMVAMTLVVPWLDRSGEPEGSEYHYAELRSAPTASDYGLEDVIRHPSLSEGGFAMVTYSIGGEGALAMAAMLQWELYGRNDTPVISRYNHPVVTLPACHYDLARSSHFLTNRVLSALEVDTLTSLGYEPRISSTPRIRSLGTLQLWQRVGRWQR
jgi:hypothetical protein